MLTRITNVLTARNMLILAGLVVGLFVLAGLSASLFGDDPEDNVANAIGAIGWFGFIFGLLLLIVLSIVSLVAHAIKRRELT